MAKKNTSPWVYVGCGCAGLIILAIGVVATLGFGAFSFVKDMEANLKDPAKRHEQALEILGADELPEGFRAQLNMRAPFSLFEMVMLSDGEPVEYDASGGGADLDSENMGKNAFFFMAMPDVGDARREFERLLEGDGMGELDDVNVDVNFDFRSRQVLGHGEMEIPPQNIRYAAHSGQFRGQHEDRDGTYAVMLFDCPGSSKVRVAFYWQTQEVAEIAGGENVELEGTAYEEELRRFMGHFDVCS